MPVAIEIGIFHTAYSSIVLSVRIHFRLILEKTDEFVAYDRAERLM